MRKSFFLLWVLLPLVGTAQIENSRGVIVGSEVKKKTGTTYAIVIGISRYREVNMLQYADRDAKIFADYLVNSKGMALDSNHVRLFLNERATLSNIGNALSEIIIKDLKKGDRIIFFFAGHGDYDANILRDQALLLLYGAPKQNYFQNIFSGDYISTADLNSRFIEPVSNKGCDVLLFIDACHSTGLNKQLSGGVEGGKITGMALQSMTSAVKIYSCKANQYSLESEKWGGGRGLFSYVLMEALYGMADADNNKVITLLELQRYLEDNIPKMAAPNQQFPIIKTDNSDETVAKVNAELLNWYKTRSDTIKVVPPPETVKITTARGVINPDPSIDELYKTCDSLIKKDNLETAYQVFMKLVIVMKLVNSDSTSESCSQLRASLGNALQQLANTLLIPLQSDISAWNATTATVISAVKNLEMALAVIGETNFSYKNLQAKHLFLKAQLPVLENSAANQEAIGFLEQSLLLEPNAPYTYFYLARRYHRKGELEKARTNFDKYVDLIPNSAWAYNNRGWVYNDLKQYAEAITNFKKAIELNPEFEAAYNNVGTTLVMLKNYEEAISYYKKAIALRSDNPIVYNNMGNAYAEIKKYEEAVFNISKAIELKPDYAAAYVNLGRAYLYLNKYDSAVINYKKAIDLRPDNMVALKNLGVAYAYLRNFDEAIACYKKGISLQSDCGDCYYSLSGLYSLQNDTTASLSHLDQALQKKYNNLKKIESDPNINSIRLLPGFKALLEKYFTKEELDKYPKLFVRSYN